MKSQYKGFAAGVLTAALVGSLGVTTLAASGAMTINVDPINIQVNGQTFQPKDAQGADVPVFAYNGTTYAPLRALAEAYGLTVGYDASSNMATVSEPGAAPATPTPNTTAPSSSYSDWSAEEEAAYQEFKGLWEVTIETRSSLGQFINAKYIGKEPQADVVTLLSNSAKTIARFSTERADKNIPSNPFSFYFGDEMIANVVMINGCVQAIYVGETRIN